MKSATLLLFIVMTFPSLATQHLSNSKGKLDRTQVIHFSNNQIKNFKKIIFDNKGHYINGNFPKAYRYIYSQLITMNTHSNPRIDPGTLFWFDKADNINESSGWSSYMIRTYTTLESSLPIATLETYKKSLMILPLMF